MLTPLVQTFAEAAIVCIRYKNWLKNRGVGKTSQTLVYQRYNSDSYLDKASEIKYMLTFKQFLRLTFPIL